VAINTLLASFTDDSHTKRRGPRAGCRPRQARGVHP
jgi:hypothetical protein